MQEEWWNNFYDWSKKYLESNDIVDDDDKELNEEVVVLLEYLLRITGEYEKDWRRWYDIS